LSTNSYTVTGTGANGCSDTAKIVIQVKQLPNINTTLNGKTITAVETGATYQWINCFDKTKIIGENVQTFAAKTNGKYAVVISKNGCIDTSACVDVIMSGIYQNETIKQITIYPNPNYGAFTIKANSEGLFTIQNGLGQTLQIVRLDANNNYSVNLEHFNPGIYFIVGSMHDQITKQTFVVTK
ncbi:MAG: T9SS type A sorting domain-containing protein, partial [Bacteroidetes bacterium]|nr:T9SS type A sorting domain-containing protein [Bacteroidota bacterium]